jgi:hypothetical protein
MDLALSMNAYSAVSITMRTAWAMMNDLEDFFFYHPRCSLARIETQVDHYQLVMEGILSPGEWES